MPRPRKKGLDYFPLDVDFFSDQKVKILKARFGADGISCYLYLLCEIYKNGFYLDAGEDLYYVMSEDLKMDVNKVKQVLKFLLERSLLDNTLFQSDTILTSAGIQKRFQLAVKERAKKTPIEIPQGLWLLEKRDTEPFIKVGHEEGFSQNNEGFSGKNVDNSRKNDTKKSKEKKSKGNINQNKSAGAEQPPKKKVLQHYPEDEELAAVFADYMEMRKKIRKPMTERAITLVKNKLNKLASVNGFFDRNLAISILNQSIMNSWQGVFPLKEDYKSSDPKPQTSNKFHNFEQRSYDYAELEKRLTARRQQ